jgi:hypothetical protein
MEGDGKTIQSHNSRGYLNSVDIRALKLKREGVISISNSIPKT